MQTNNVLIFTDAAAQKVRELIYEEGNYNLNLRLYIEGGGCSGFKYHFTFDENINENDWEIEKKFNDQEPLQIVKLIIDSMSANLVIGASVDYREDINGAQFVITNPNAKTTCGCGSSFAT
ncbi:MAG: Iron-sulfur cluster insertion protein ErpA [Legionellaceae bacterium]